MAPPLLLVAVALLARKPMQRWWYAETGLQQWNALAASLPWRDRWSLYRANQRGRAAPHRLASLAVQRGRTMIAVTERTIDRMSGVSRIWPIVAGVGVLMVALQLAQLAADINDRLAWLNLIIWIVLIAQFGTMGPMLRRQLRLLRRSVQLNSELIQPGTA